MTKKEEIRSILMAEGADAVGFVSADRFEGAPSGQKPNDILPGAKSVITMAARIPHGVFISKNLRLVTNAWNLANSQLNHLSYKISKILEDHGYNAAPVSPFLPIDILGKSGLVGDLSHKHAAELSGIGRIGLNNLLITKRFGPRVRLISVVTDFPFHSDSLLTEDFCLGCSGKFCVQACPVGAIGTDGKLSKVKCLDTYQAFGGRKMIRLLRELLDTEGIEEKMAMLKYPRMLELLEVHQFLRVGGVSCMECLRVCPVGERPSPISRSFSEICDVRQTS